MFDMEKFVRVILSIGNIIFDYILLISRCKTVPKLHCFSCSRVPLKACIMTTAIPHNLYAHCNDAEKAILKMCCVVSGINCQETMLSLDFVNCFGHGWPKIQWGARKRDGLLALYCNSALLLSLNLAAVLIELSITKVRPQLSWVTLMWLVASPGACCQKPSHQTSYSLERISTPGNLPISH